MKKIAIITNFEQTGQESYETIDYPLILKPETTVQEIVLYYQNKGFIDCTIKLVTAKEAGEI